MSRRTSSTDVLGQVRYLVYWLSLRQGRGGVPGKLRRAVSSYYYWPQSRRLRDVYARLWTRADAIGLHSFLDSSLYIVKRLEEQRHQAP